VSLYKQYFAIIGLLVLTVVICVLLLPASMILARTVAFIDTTSYRASSDQIPVRTKMDIGDSEHMRAFPEMVGKWVGIDYEASQIEEWLNADVVLMRAYRTPNFDHPVFLLLVRSNDPVSFHPPVVCYPALGYQIEEEGKEKIPLTNVEWVSYWRSETEQKVASSINTNKLVVFKEVDEGVIERRVVLYFYVKEEPIVGDTLTMIRISMLVPADISCDEEISMAKDFVADVIPYLFELYETKEEPVAAQLSESGIGWLVMVISVTTPLMMVVFSLWRQ